MAEKAYIDENLGKKIKPDRNWYELRRIAIISVCLLIGFAVINLVMPFIFNKTKGKISEETALFNIFGGWFYNLIFGNTLTDKKCEESEIISNFDDILQQQQTIEEESVLEEPEVPEPEAELAAPEPTSEVPEQAVVEEPEPAPEAPVLAPEGLDELANNLEIGLQPPVPPPTPIESRELTPEPEQVPIVGGARKNYKKSGKRLSEFQWYIKNLVPLYKKKYPKLKHKEVFKYVVQLWNNDKH